MTGVLASVSLALILAGRMSKPSGVTLKNANNGRRNKGALLYPGIGKAKTFAEAAEILGDDGSLAELNRRWGLERFDKAEETSLTHYKATSTKIPIYAGPGKQFAKINHNLKRGNVEIKAEKDGFGKLASAAGWIELAKVKTA